MTRSCMSQPCPGLGCTHSACCKGLHEVSLCAPDTLQCGQERCFDAFGQERCFDALCADAGIHVGLDALADLPLAKLRKQLDVNLIAQVSVTQVRHSCLSRVLLHTFAISYRVTYASWCASSQQSCICAVVLRRRSCPYWGQT